ncbi:hypothetical protein DICPUDRAFT_150588 [Dictyostelium purpureum]|uniref:Uncharacterized protein n=1 Tax=Dictyostelium purpureum TaxID=5786 RepID=F0ZGQ4_DICPU|nr:uncharacterized protein DICPUDRAFT_150588 [Dictyostelium purpureum]EGC36865.1 hypothetical protein DICPUDRAFT_150588 [Dictyostelium purpureum]|eukprot:XP_003286587.1 hypothetical protein DICPUDRAFT_150588 [Dictyostelium purpureum]
MDNNEKEIKDVEINIDSVRNSDDNNNNNASSSEYIPPLSPPTIEVCSEPSSPINDRASIDNNLNSPIELNLNNNPNNENNNNDNNNDNNNNDNNNNNNNNNNSSVEININNIHNNNDNNNESNNINLSNANSEQLINQPYPLYPPAPSYFYQYNVDGNGHIIHTIDEIDTDATSLPPPVRLEKSPHQNNSNSNVYSSNGFYPGLQGLASVSAGENDPNAQSPSSNNYYSSYSRHHASPPPNSRTTTNRDNNNTSIARKNRTCCTGGARKIIPGIIVIILCAVILELRGKPNYKSKTSQLTISQNFDDCISDLNIKYYSKNIIIKKVDKIVYQDSVFKPFNSGTTLIRIYIYFQDKLEEEQIEEQENDENQYHKPPKMYNLN